MALTFESSRLHRKRMAAHLFEDIRRNSHRHNSSRIRIVAVAVGIIAVPRIETGRKNHPRVVDPPAAMPIPIMIAPLVPVAVPVAAATSYDSIRIAVKPRTIAGAVPIPIAAPTRTIAGAIPIPVPPREPSPVRFPFRFRSSANHHRCIQFRVPLNCEPSLVRFPFRLPFNREPSPVRFQFRLPPPGLTRGVLNRLVLCGKPGAAVRACSVPKRRAG